MSLLAALLAALHASGTTLPGPPPVLSSSAPSAAVWRAPDSPQLGGEEAAEPLYSAALAEAARERAEGGTVDPRPLLDRIEAALWAGACPTRTATEAAFAALRTNARFRALIRRHARQSVSVMVVPGEPGERLFFSGTVRDSTGHPVADALVYAYQTDARGIYSPGGESAPRIFGFARTDTDGCYGFHTIRPGHSPDPEEPVEAHVHLEVTPPEGPVTIARLGFADDPHWQGPGWMGRPAPGWAVPVERTPDGIQRCVLDIRLPEQASVDLPGR